MADVEVEAISQEHASEDVKATKEVPKDVENNVPETPDLNKPEPETETPKTCAETNCAEKSNGCGDTKAETEGCDVAAEAISQEVSEKQELETSTTVELTEAACTEAVDKPHDETAACCDTKHHEETSSSNQTDDKPAVDTVAEASDVPDLENDAAETACENKSSESCEPEAVKEESSQSERADSAHKEGECKDAEQQADTTAAESEMKSQESTESTTTDTSEEPKADSEKKEDETAHHCEKKEDEAAHHCEKKEDEAAHHCEKKEDEAAQHCEKKGEEPEKCSHAHEDPQKERETEKTQTAE